MPLHVQFKEYVARITQTGTDTPVATVLSNTLGGEVVLSRPFLGNYLATLNGVFGENKTFLSAMLNSEGTAVSMWGYRVDNNSVRFGTYDPSGDNVDAEGVIYLEIRVYP